MSFRPYCSQSRKTKYFSNWMPFVQLLMLKSLTFDMGVTVMLSSPVSGGGDCLLYTFDNNATQVMNKKEF